MRCVKNFFISLLILLLLFSDGIVMAMNSGFVTESLPDETADRFINNTNLSMLSTEPPKKAIECFSVNEDGLIAIGCGDLICKTVCVYTADGEFQYGYSFDCNGSFGVELNENVLYIYFVRSDIAIAVDSTGKIESILGIQNTIENNSYWNNCVFSNERKVGDTEYILKNRMGILNLFATSYSQLITMDENGGETIIYDVNTSQFSSMVVIFIGVIIFACLVFAIVIFQFLKLKRSS